MPNTELSTNENGAIDIPTIAYSGGQQSFAPDFDPWNTPGEQYTGIPSPGAAVFPWYAFAPIGPVPDFPTIGVAFSQPVAVSNLTNPANLSVWRSPLLGFMGRVGVNGTWNYASTGSISPEIFPNGPHSVLVFTPTDTILPNNRYMIHIGQSLVAESGAYLGATARSYFFSRLFPFLTDPYAVQQVLGEFQNRVSGEQLFYEIWKASCTCNRETMRYCPPNMWGGPTAQQVISWNAPRTFAHDEFTRFEAAENILKTLRGKFILEVNREQVGLDFTSKVDGGLIKNLDSVIKSVHQQRDKFYQEISIKKAHIAHGQKSSLYPFQVIGSRDFALYGGRRPRGRF